MTNQIIDYLNSLLLLDNQEFTQLPKPGSTEKEDKSSEPLLLDKSHFEIWGYDLNRSLKKDKRWAKKYYNFYKYTTQQSIRLIEPCSPSELIRVESWIRGTLEQFYKQKVFQNKPKSKLSTTVLCFRDLDYNEILEQPNEELSDLIKYMFDPHYRTVRKVFKELLRVIGEMKQIGLSSRKPNNRDVIERVQPPEIFNNKIKEGNWDHHYQNTSDNLEILKSLEPVYFDKSDIKLFYKLLNGNTRSEKVSFKGNASQLKALLDGIGKNPSFNEIYHLAYFKITSPMYIEEVKLD